MRAAELERRFVVVFALRGVAALVVADLAVAVLALAAFAVLALAVPAFALVLRAAVLRGEVAARLGADDAPDPLVSSSVHLPDMTR